MAKVVHLKGVAAEQQLVVKIIQFQLSCRRPASTRRGKLRQFPTIETPGSSVSALPPALPARTSTQTALGASCFQRGHEGR